MGKGRRYDQEYKNMILDLFKSGMSLSEISSEYSIAKSTINGWIKDVKEIKVDENEVITLKEVKEYGKNQGRKWNSTPKAGFSQKSYGHICNQKLDKVIEFINNNKSKHNIKTMCTVLGVARSTYYKYFCKTKSARENRKWWIKKSYYKNI